MALGEEVTMLVNVVCALGIGYTLMVVFRHCYRCLKIDRALRLVPTSEGNMLVGKAWQLAASPYPWKLLDRWCEEFSSSIVQFTILGKRVVYANDPKVAQILLINQVDKFSRDLSLTTSPYAGYSAFLGDGILTATGKSWAQVRSQAGHGIDVDVLPSKTLQAIHRVVGLLRTAEIFEAPVDLADTFSHMSLQLSAELLLGVSHSDCDELFPSTYLPLVAECERRVWKPWRQFQPWLRDSRKFRNSLHKLEQTLLSLVRVRWALVRAEANETQGPSRRERDVLDSLLSGFSPRTPLTREEERKVVDNVKNLLLLYHRPLTSVLSWAFFELLTHPELALHLSREWENQFGMLTPGEAPSVERLRSLRWAPAFLHETLRKYPPLPVLSRITTEPVYMKREESGLADDVVIPEGVHVLLGIEGIHHRGDLWPEPEKFLPQRFLDLEQELTHGSVEQLSFIPFLSGSRMCPGSDAAFLQLSMIISYIATAMTDSVPLNDGSIEEKLVFEFAADPLKLKTQLDQHLPPIPKHGLPIKPLPREERSSRKE